MPVAKRLRRVTLTRYYTGRSQRRDRGNLIGGMKPILDALVRQGFLVDDSEQWCEDHYAQVRHEMLAGVAVMLEELVSP